MKNYLLIIFFLFWRVLLSAQSVYPIRTDTLKVYTGSTVPGAGGELLLQNASRGVLNGLLTNINDRGNTEFRNLALTSSGNIPSGSILRITGQGSVALPWLKPYVDTMYLSAGNLLYVKNGNTYTVTLPTAPVYTASNYLTKTGNNFTLGGTATGNTVLNASTFTFTLQGADAIGGSGSFSLGGGSTSIQQSVSSATTTSGIANTFNTVDLTSTTTGSSNALIRVSPVLTSMNLTSAGKTSSFSLSTGLNLVNDGISAVGLTYADNYGENNLVNPRWLVDKNYVDSSIIAGAGSGYTAGNLLTLVGNQFELGTGGATHATQMPLGLFGLNMNGSDNTGTTSTFEINNSSSSNFLMSTIAATTGSSLTIDQYNVQANNLSSSGSVRSQVNVANNKALLQFMTGIGTGSQRFTEIDMQAGGALLTDQIAAKGLRYALNYAENNAGDTRWLTDKGYVDSTVAVNSGTAYTAGNLLSLTGSAFELGGTATQNTVLTLGTNELDINEDAGSGKTAQIQIATLGGTPTIGLSAISTSATAGLTVSPFGSLLSYIDLGTNFLSQYTADGNGIGTLLYNQTNSTSTGLRISTTNSTFEDQNNFLGIQYGFNYAENSQFNPRWIPDKNYVDSMITATVPALQSVTDAGSTVNTPGIVVSFNSPSGTAGAQVNVSDVLGSTGFLQAFNDGTNSWGQLVLQGDTSKIVTSHDLTFSTDAGLNYGIIHVDGTFTDGSGKVNQAIRSVSASTTALLSDYTILVNNGAAATITLPPAIQCAKKIMVIKKISGASLNVTIDGNGAELIDGAATQVMTLQYSSVMIQCDGSGWNVLSAFAGGTPL